MKLSRRTIILLRVITPAIIVASFFLLIAHTDSMETGITPEDRVSLIEATTTSVTITNPKYLVIPAINLKANIEHVGKGFTGNMAVPPNYTDVGWYRGGYYPGENGNAVIDGHIDNGWGIKAVFGDLHLLNIGDPIYVQDASGTTVEFKVVSKEVYPYNNAPLATIFGSSTTSMLNLITCNGSWLDGKIVYNDRLVVFAQKV